MATVCFSYPYLTVAFVLVFLMILILDIIMNSGVRQTKKLDNLMKSKVVHHITNTMEGVVTIRWFHKENFFKKRFVSVGPD